MKKAGTVCLMIVVVILLRYIVLWGKYVIINDLQRGTGVEKEMRLQYVGEYPVDYASKQLDSQHVYCWSLSSPYSYSRFEEWMHLDSTKVFWGLCMGESYVVSYGRKLLSATYNTDYFVEFPGTEKGETVEAGYEMEFVRDESNYQADTVYIYRTDPVFWTDFD